MQRGATRCRRASDGHASARVAGTSEEALIAGFRPALVAHFIRRLSSPEEAEDLAHEVIIRLLRRQGTAQIAALRPYVFEVARSVLIDRGRKDRVRCSVRHELLTEAIPDTGQHECERAMMAREDVARVEAGLRELPDRTRSIFLLRRVEGMQHRDIAGSLGISLSTVEKHVRLAALHLKGCLESPA